MAGSNPETDNMSPIVAYDSKVIIANSATKSGLIDILGNTLVCVILPAGFSGTQISFEASVDTAAANFFPMRTRCEVAKLINLSASSAWITITNIDFRSVRYLKLVSDVVQVGNIEITLGVRPV